MAKLTMDGRELEFAPGTSLIQLAEKNGIEIPYYCWHPRLSIAANCRMCLVEVEKAPKLQPACEAICRDGMVVHTKSKKVLEARASVQEFLLINHPIDCPICDQAGECKLQNYYMKHDKSGTRFDEIKVPKKKAVILGPTVVLDEERCINCTRCVRFMAEVRHNPQLGQFERGDRACIGIYPGKPLDDPYSANVADICPVGALTYRDFRFKVRSWFLKHTDTVCNGCARGCSTILDHHNNEPARIRARDNDAINKGWLCDEGRLTYKRIHDKDTAILEPHARINGKLTPIGWDKARQMVAEILGKYTSAGDGALGMALSSQVSTEGATAFVELAEQVLQVDSFAITGLPDGKGDDFLRTQDQNPNRAGLELVLEAYSIFDEGPEALKKAVEGGKVKTLIMVGSDFNRADEAWQKALESIQVLAISSNWDESSKAATLVLPLASYAEQDGTFVNIDGRMQRINRALAPLKGRKGAVESAAFLAVALGAGSQWSIHNWITAFNRLKKQTNLLKNVTPTSIGPWGVLLEAEATSQKPAAQASAQT
ncbi:MAG: 2Fe-2S iron-sulfur cluster-binding protein [Myxococcota bacterium]